MTQKYEDNFWGQIDFLHQKSRREFTSFNYFIDMLNKFHDACSEFSKKVQNIISKNHEIIECHSASMHEVVEKFIQLIELFANEFKETQNNIKKQIIDPIFKPTTDMFNQENELYNTYNESRSTYIEKKTKLEKYYNNYISKMKICENLIFNSKQIDLMLYAGEKEKQKNLKNANNSIKNAKPEEEKYIGYIEKVNKARENEIKNQEDLLKFFKKLDINFYEKIKFGLGIYFNLINKLCNSIIASNQFLGKAYNKISIENDIKEFISSNKGEKKIQPISKFIPYQPFSDPTNKKEDATKLDIYFEVIKTLKSNFKDIRLDLDLDEEEKRKRLRYLCERILKIGSNVSFPKEEKNELLSLLINPGFRKYFINSLTKQRTKGKIKRSESLVNDLSEILLKVLELAENEKDYEIANNCILLSQSYYFEEKNNEKKKDKKSEPNKIFLFTFITKNKWLKSIEFWEGLISMMIDKEIKQNKAADGKQGIEETEIIKQNRLSNICFSQLLTYGTHMLEFGIDKKEIEKTVEKFSEKYEVSKDLTESIYSNIELKQEEIIHSSSSKNLEQDKEKKEKEKEVSKSKENKKILEKDNIKSQENNSDNKKDISKEKKEKEKEENKEIKEMEEIKEIKENKGDEEKIDIEGDKKKKEEENKKDENETTINNKNDNNEVKVDDNINKENPVQNLEKENNLNVIEKKEENKEENEKKENIVKETEVKEENLEENVKKPEVNENK